MQQQLLWGEAKPPPAPLPLRCTFTPRDYQQEAIDSAFALYDQGERGILVRSPTGCGKTLIGAMIADRHLLGEKSRVLVIAHERQLVWQFAEEIEEALGIKCGIEMGQNHVSRKDIPLVTVACRASLYQRKVDGNILSRLHKFKNQYHWLVLWDEAHKHAYSLRSVRHIREWFDLYPDNWHVGLTATPERTDKKSLARMFPAVACDYRLFTLDERCAVNDGWAVPYDQRYVQVEGIDFKNLREVGGDFDEGELEAVLSHHGQLAKLIVPTLDIVGDRRTIVFSPTRQMAKDVAQWINAHKGDTIAYHLDGTFPEDARKDVYARFARGGFQYLSVCGLCREGFNDPGIGAVAIYRPTKSRSLAEQMKGRGCRPLRGLLNGLETPEARKAAIANSTKPNCLIVDLVGATGLGDCASTVQIYADGLPDEVVGLAEDMVQEAQKKGEPVNVAEKVAEAREKWKERQAEKARREKEEAERRAKIKAEVQYQATRVKSGYAPRTTHYRPTMRMNFGKFKGVALSDVPDWYLRWAANNIRTPWMKRKFEDELTFRKDNGIVKK